ncbi:MAG: inosine-5-monophosphate dehydrogenase [Candidatus Thorarchaeota archaeon]|nr:MAG: inosine-5-monophosphate dehydrogenase [Candidatus Thorarchaeota archaeon]RLI60421.1 MAG: inosine-5-monophosphate dehydrogenase [Candidatus Thorarchaeota archaeon]
MKISLDTIARMRRRLNITQAQLAEAVGVSQAYIARLETGSLDPKLSVVNKILDVLESWGLSCSDIMSEDPVTVDARESASVVVELMLKHGFSQLPVTRAGKIVGLVTERDIVRNLMRDLRAMSVQAIMESPSPPLVDERTRIDEILPLFDSFQAVLVQRAGKLVGIVTRSDLLRLGLSDSKPNHP